MFVARPVLVVLLVGKTLRLLHPDEGMSVGCFSNLASATSETHGWLTQNSVKLHKCFARMVSVN